MHIIWPHYFPTEIHFPFHVSCIMCFIQISFFICTYESLCFTSNIFLGLVLVSHVSSSHTNHIDIVQTPHFPILIFTLTSWPAPLSYINILKSIVGSKMVEGSVIFLELHLGSSVADCLGPFSVYFLNSLLFSSL